MPSAGMKLLLSELPLREAEAEEVAPLLPRPTMNGRILGCNSRPGGMAFFFRTEEEEEEEVVFLVTGSGRYGKGSAFEMMPPRSLLVGGKGGMPSLLCRR